MKTHSQEILQVITRSIDCIHPTALQKIRNYVQDRLSGSGGFLNRADNPDLYYTLFGLSCAFVLKQNLSLDATLTWLNSFDLKILTLVDFSSLVKCLSIYSMIHNPEALFRKTCAIEAELSRFRTTDGGFSYTGSGESFPYAAFLAMNIYQDISKPIPQPQKLVSVLQGNQQTDGRFSHPGCFSSGLLLSTVAGLLIQRQLTGLTNDSAIKWIESQFTPAGGFKADPDAELPDMLSTAVALFALKVCKVNMAPYRALAKNFVEDHWLDNGSFSATLLDEMGDCEYVYYGLLSLGALHDV
ncbi:MAG: terpene cyclase/mutase family protein [Candidatus Riflebacteria bacterium]|nr:terpene cyclase/mutase family protein [Candidatus Riflebacteria bacterium]